MLQAVMERKNMQTEPRVVLHRWKKKPCSNQHTERSLNVQTDIFQSFQPY